MALGILGVVFESNRISTAYSWSSRVQGGRKTPIALLLIACISYGPLLPVSHI